LGLPEKESGGGGRVDHRIVGDQKTACETCPEVGLLSCKLAGIQNLGDYTCGGVLGTLGMNFDHFLIVGCNPQSAAALVFDCGGKLGKELPPEGAGILGKRELHGGVVHDDEVAHAGGGGA